MRASEMKILALLILVLGPTYVGTAIAGLIGYNISIMGPSQVQVPPPPLLPGLPPTPPAFYNIGVDQFSSIDPVTGHLTAQPNSNFTAGTGLFHPGTPFSGLSSGVTSTAVDTAANKMYAVTSNNMLFTFDTGTGLLLQSSQLDKPIRAVQVLGNGSLVGFDFSITGQSQVQLQGPPGAPPIFFDNGVNQLSSINPATGHVTPNSDFTVGTGLYVPAFPAFGPVLPALAQSEITSSAYNAETNRLYAVSFKTLFTFDGATGAFLLSTELDKSVSALQVLDNGSLVGFDFSITGQSQVQLQGTPPGAPPIFFDNGVNQFSSIDPVTGHLTEEPNSNFMTGLFVPGSQIPSAVISSAYDPTADLLYALTSTNTLYTFDSTTGAVVQSAQLDKWVRVLGFVPDSTDGDVVAAAPEPASLALLGLGLAGLGFSRRKKA